MSEAVRYQVRYWGLNLQEGDVLLSNHPQLAGFAYIYSLLFFSPLLI